MGIKIVKLTIKLSIICMLFNFINLSCSKKIEQSYIHVTVTGGSNTEEYTEQIIEVYSQVSNVDKVNFLFNLFDNFPKNNYLTYNEIDIFQKLTNPELKLDEYTWKWVCKVLGSNVFNGITLKEFNSSYYKYKDVLGTDLDRDYTKILKYSNSF